LDKNYKLMYEAYTKIFKRCDLNTIVVEADSGAMGGDLSHEFMVATPIGEDTVLTCSSCGHTTGVKDLTQRSACPSCKEGKLEEKIAMEIGHIFQLGTKYSEAQQATFLDESGKQKTIIMGCYGIGVSRLLAAIIETHSDKAGIIWPKEVAPFDVEILPLHANENGIMDLANEYYKDLEASGLHVLIDDRDTSAGVKFNDADLIGIPYRITIGKKMFAEDKVEIKSRATNETTTVAKSEAAKKLKTMLKTQ